MMASPADLLDFALGFSLTEGILQHPDELYDIEVVQEERGISVQMHISAERLAKILESCSSAGVALGSEYLTNNCSSKPT